MFSVVQLNEVREQIAALKSTLAEDAVHTKEDLKFELMHEKSPQFSNLKDFISAQVTSLHIACACVFIASTHCLA